MNSIPSVYIAALITSLLALGFIGSALYGRTPRDEHRFILLLILLQLPMCWLAFHVVRQPFDSWLARLLGQHQEWHQFIRCFYAPLTEEPAKLWPLLLPWIYNRISGQNFVRVAIALGLGFGVGEAWTVAGLISTNPAAANIPWYLLGGYMGERFMVCLMHAAFCAAALQFIIKQRWPIPGLAAAMTLHFIGNFPIYLAWKHFLGFGDLAWTVMVQLWVLLYFFLMSGLLARLAFGKGWLRRITGKRKCPECGTIHSHALFGVNLLLKSYERCPACKHWHLVDTLNLAEKLEGP